MIPTFHPALHLLEPAVQYTLSASHGSRFQPLLYHLLTLFSGEGIIPAMTEEEIMRVVYLSRFHDIGKQSLPKSILYKPGKLTAKERVILEQHPVQGVTLLRSIPKLREYPFYHMVCDICLHHHERWDGGGYPDSLKAGEITPYVHVVGLADAYDALRTVRPYKRALSHQEALSMLCNGDCGVFDPDMIACFRDSCGHLCASCYGGERKVG